MESTHRPDLNVQQRKEKYQIFERYSAFFCKDEINPPSQPVSQGENSRIFGSNALPLGRRLPSSCTSPWHWPTRPWSPTMSSSRKWRASYKQPSWPTDIFPSMPWRAWFSMELPTARSSTSWARRTTSPTRSFCWGRPLALADASFANRWLYPTILQE